MYGIILNEIAPNRDNLGLVCGDRSFTCPTRELTRVLAGSDTKTYYYYLSHRASNEEWHPWMGVIHGADVQVWGAYSYMQNCKSTLS